MDLIASGNNAGPRVMKVMGVSLSNKYTDGYPGKCCYGGRERIDSVEQLTIDHGYNVVLCDMDNTFPAYR